MSDTLGSLVLVALLASAVLGMIFFAQLANRPHGALAASLAGRWNGRVRKGGLFGSDWLELRIDGVAGEVTFGDRRANYPGWTRVIFDWASDRRLRVAPEVFSSRIRRLFGGSDIEFDDPAFDQGFWVESSHPMWARDVLGREARRGLMNLRRAALLDGPGTVTLDIGPAGVVLRITQVMVDNSAALGGLVELAIAILHRAKGLVAEAGVTLEQVRTRAGSTCPVCGQAVADEALPCPTCRTPHHLDCWKYFGGCAIFGCRTRMRRERS